jgi:CRISPR type III-B/RAMP module-associated protein Cmr5
MPGTIQYLERERAAFALTYVKKMTAPESDGSNPSSTEISSLKSNAKYFRSYIESLPSAIRNNNFIAAFSFIKGKRKPDKTSKNYAYYLIYELMAEWLRKQNLLNQTGDLIHILITDDSVQLRMITIEALALCEWLKRIAKAEIEEVAPDSN